MNITAEQVKAVLIALGEEFTIDIPAVHNETGNWIEYNQLNGSLVLADDEWVEQIVEYVNTNN